jgi:hypothetical protein
MNESFEKVRKMIQSILLKHSFTKIEEKFYPEIFGSCHVIFQNPQEQIRLIWDGKEHWFLLESISDLPETYKSGWTDILLQPFKPGHDRPEAVDKIAEDLKIALLDYLGSRYLKSS